MPRNTELAPATDRTLTGSTRQMSGVLVVADESPVPSPLRRVTNSAVKIEVAQDGSGVLTLTYFDDSPEQSVAIPADVTCALDRALFGVELNFERIRRERLAAGDIACPTCDGKGWVSCPACKGAGVVSIEQMPVVARPGEEGRHAV